MRKVTIIATLLAAFILGGGQARAQGDPQTADSQTVDSQPQDVDLPVILSGSDLEHYQRIFSAQADADWQQADKEIRKLKNKILLGHVLHQRYMHPTAYVSSFAELSDWLKHYRDEPGAEQIYALAMRKKGRKQKAPLPPIGVDLGDYSNNDPGLVATTRRQPQLKEREPAHSHAIARAESQFNSLLRRDRLKDAEALLAHADIRKRLSASEYDDWRRRLAWLWLLDGEDAKALDLASAAAERSRARVPEADWIAGLAAWRLGRYDNAGHHFENLAFSRQATSWDRSAGAWWGARVMLRLREPSEAIRLLEIGAREPYTFYGQLCLSQLGGDEPFSWTPPPLDKREIRKLTAIPAVRRALALSEVGEAVRADREISRLFTQSNDQLAAALLGLASRMQAPASSMRIGIAWYNVKGENYDQALYPLPPWEPDDGFVVDRALIFAVMRQESAFNARAMSAAGAAGLMQLMPNTAGAVAGDRSLRHKRGRHKLFAPEYNIELGQRYLQNLLQMPMINGNLLYLAAAYNAGPGNLQRWLRETPDADKDPLLFIETIPLSETRLFVQRVLTNYWIYRSRIGQPDTSIADAVMGNWPLYRPLDGDLQTANRR
ncbi:MAG TPA: lytic transglycosylase domain-containing protein [Ferrovibrio sp.]|uniref:lytic transglycosylase domain-containing protein n=1 Tax=Ferrovibrio sp. TaxID=1917215 RepID=UPI002ED2F10F